MEALLPFLRWFPLNRTNLRVDIIAGITVALILVPQSMAYAQLAGLPVVYGLYASLLPVIVGAMWGSSNQLHTGPVAMLALISAITIVPFATPGSDKFIELSIMLALMVGVFRLALGMLRLGALVNLLSSPVIVGFTNAAALIIGFSLLAEVFNVPFPRSNVFMADLWHVVEQIREVHLPTLVFAAATAVVVLGLRRYLPRIPGILVAVVIGTMLSWAIGFENNEKVPLATVEDSKVKTEMLAFADTEIQLQALTVRLSELKQQLRGVKQSVVQIEIEAGLHAQVEVAQRKIAALKSENNSRKIDLYAVRFTRVEQTDGHVIYHADYARRSEQRWHFGKIVGDQVVFTGGGRVVGNIPVGLPTFAVPHMHWDLFTMLLPGALIMALIGFLEATSISKAISAMTRERINPSRELIGQGLANIVGSFFHSFVVSGSFSRSAVAAKMGARTGIFAVVSALAVALVLMFFTSFLYHLPLAVLSVIVILSVFDLIMIRPLLVAWKVDRPGAIAGVITFAATLAMAPSIANGVLIGVAITVLQLLMRQMTPHTSVLGVMPDGRLSDIRRHELEPLSQNFVTVRYDGSINFLNAAHFEEEILSAHAEFPAAKTILVIGSGINNMDASGEEKIREIAEYMREAKVNLAFSSLKQHVRLQFERAGLPQLLGEDNLFLSREVAFETLCRRASGQGIEPVKAAKQDLI